jgi:hypothetical protein
VTKLGKLWTGAVAYVSLLVGAGLSVAGNLADTYRTRGADIDNLDKVMAAGWPILVLLAIEMFVSPRWSPARMFQAWRWIGCLAVGGMAMVVSWTHLHDLMASRGQLYVVSVLGPLAIDGMAIMATGLILSTRVRGHVSVGVGRSFGDIVDTMATGQRVSADTDTATFKERMSAAMAVDADTRDTIMRVNVAADMTDTDTPRSWADLVGADNKLMDWVSGQERAHADIADTLAAEAEAHLSAVTSAPSLPKRTRTASGLSAPAEFMVYAASWDPIELDRADMVKLSAAYFQVSDRTARRWLAAVTGAPMSGPPEQS